MNRVRATIAAVIHRLIAHNAQKAQGPMPLEVHTHIHLDGNEIGNAVDHYLFDVSKLPPSVQDRT